MVASIPHRPRNRQLQSPPVERLTVGRNLPFPDNASIRLAHTIADRLLVYVQAHIMHLQVHHASPFQAACCSYQKKPLWTYHSNNLSSHKVAGVRELIEATGAELLYLPPYSPDLNPIEKAWSKLKQALRSAKARSVDALQQALSEAIPTISPNNAQAW